MKNLLEGFHIEIDLNLPPICTTCIASQQGIRDL